ncbi:MAG: UbiA family prenyltransferase, partial [Chloroflexi bacterium]|nr:UbiA family prenyltransferase [Chloroflexota bacterium]
PYLHTSWDTTAVGVAKRVVNATRPRLRWAHPRGVTLDRLSASIRSPALVVADRRAVAIAYFALLKPRVTVLLTFLGAAAATIAAGADTNLAGRVMLVTLAVFFGSGGANGLTNYLDRAVDARMRRTRRRSIPSGRVFPAQRALVWSLAWAATGVTLGLLINPFVAMAGLVGIAASVIFRKTEATHFLGSVASASPVAAGWLAVDPTLSLGLLSLLAFVAAWVLHHVWAIMLFYRRDYLKAGVTMYPIKTGVGRSQPVFIAMAAVLVILTVGTGMANGAAWAYYVIGGTFAIFNVWGTIQLARPRLAPAIRRRRFKTASYSLLCGVFATLFLDIVVTNAMS